MSVPHETTCPRASRPNFQFSHDGVSTPITHGLRWLSLSLFSHSLALVRSERAIFTSNGIWCSRQILMCRYFQAPRESHVLGVGWVFTCHYGRSDYPSLGTLLSLKSEALMLFLVEFRTGSIFHCVACVDNLTQTSLLILGGLIIRSPTPLVSIPLLLLLSIFGQRASHYEYDINRVGLHCLSITFTRGSQDFRAFVRRAYNTRYQGIYWEMERNFLSASVTFVGLRHFLIFEGLVGCIQICQRECKYYLLYGMEISSWAAEQNRPPFH